MILPAGSAGTGQGRAPWPARVAYLARGAGMGGHGFNLVTPAPGERASGRHGHSHAARLAIEGQPSVIETDSSHLSDPGDAAIRAAGIAIAHGGENRSNMPARFRVAGTSPGHDILHDPVSRRARHKGAAA